MNSSRYINTMPVPQVGMGQCGCNQYGDGILDDIWSGVKGIGKGLKAIGLAPSKLAQMATAPLAAINPALGGVAFATGEALRQAGYGKKKKKTKRVKRKTKRK